MKKAYCAYGKIQPVLLSRIYLPCLLIISSLILIILPAITLAANANISPSSLDLTVSETGSWTISGDDGGNQREFRWDIPSGLDVSKGSSSNLNKFSIDFDKMRVKIESDGRGSFSATVKVSADSSGNYDLQNTRAEISLDPQDVSINVGGSSGSSSPSPSPPTGGGSSGGSADYTLYIDTGVVNITASPETNNGATTIPVWGYTTSSSNRTVPGPNLTSKEGDTVTIEVINNHNIDHNFVINGISSDKTAIPPGGSRSYTFTTSTAGVFLYRDTLNNGINQSLGLFGAFVVGTADGSNRAWSNGPKYTDKRVWVINDMDKPNWNKVADGGGNVDTGKYKPNYFLMNGMNGFQAMGDDVNTNLSGTANSSTFLVQVVNAGQLDQALHFHGNHFEIISQDGSRLSQPIEQTTINVKAGTTVMLIYSLIWIGHLPMHVHTAQMETGNGVYLNGTAAMIIGH